MDELQRPDRESDAKSRLGAIVREHRLPGFVTDVEFQFGETQGEPAVWVIFKTQHDLPNDKAEADHWVAEANALADRVRANIIDTGEPRFPYVRFEPAFDATSQAE